MSINQAGAYAGIPIYTDPYMEVNKIMIMKHTAAKPDRNARVKRPQTKGLQLDRVKAFIVHPDTADKIEQLISEQTP
jgi:hypothetical protein